MLGLLSRGDTLASVSELFQVSRERVRYLVRRYFPDKNWRPQGRPAKKANAVKAKSRQG